LNSSNGWRKRRTLFWPYLLKNVFQLACRGKTICVWQESEMEGGARSLQDVTPMGGQGKKYHHCPAEKFTPIQGPSILAILKDVWVTMELRSINKNNVIQGRCHSDGIYILYLKVNPHSSAQRDESWQIVKNVPLWPWIRHPDGPEQRPTLFDSHMCLCKTLDSAMRKCGLFESGAGNVVGRYCWDQVPSELTKKKSWGENQPISLDIRDIIRIS